MRQIKEEYLAAGLRKQIILLQQLIEDTNKRAAGPEVLTARIRAVEATLRTLRSELMALARE